MGKALHITHIDGRIPEDFPNGVYIRNGMCNNDIVEKFIGFGPVETIFTLYILMSSFMLELL